jgi:nucleoside-diphosphate-sugar epimerase
VKKNILITGANGLVGSSLIRYLSNKNFEITGTFNKNKKNLIKKKNIKYIQ